ncbi:hypothetical protein C0993_011120, partial [Termitomyces sp. T159_Od127]
MSRYSLRSQQPGKAIRRLSPTAIRNTGPIQRSSFPGALDELGQSPLSDVTDPEPYIRRSASASFTAMPTSDRVDAAEPRASGNDVPVKVDEQEKDSSSSLADVNEQNNRSNISPVSDSNTSYSTPTQRFRNPRVEELTEEADSVLAEAHSQLTDTERERIERRMEKVLSFQTFQNEGEPPEPGENPLGKGKGIDPHNWGNIQLEDPEYDIQVQQQLLAQCNEQREMETHSNLNKEPANGYNTPIDGLGDNEEPE